MLRLRSARHLRSALTAIALGVTLLWGASAQAASVERIGGVEIGGDAALAAAAPGVRMPAGILRTSDGRTLWDRSADEERAMASITKVMTALVVLDHAEPSDTVTVSARAAAVGESGVNLIAGQQMTVQRMLEAMLVQSANDAAFALAEHVSGDSTRFVALMNEKAAALGLEHTAFANPHGLDAIGHHTTASDLATLTSVAMADPRFAAIVGMPSVSVASGGTTAVYESSNQLLGSYTGATGVKTGWTDDAGYCLAASAQRGEVGFIAIVLGTSSEDERFDEARTLLDWGYAHYALTPVAAAETTASLVPVTDYLDRTVTAVVAEDAVVPVFDLDGAITSRADVLTEVEAPVVAGQRLGTLTVSQGNRLLAQVPIVATADVPRPDAWESLGIWFTRAWRSAFGGQLQAAPVAVM